jgi:hypothetical protein
MNWDAGAVVTRSIQCLTEQSRVSLARDCFWRPCSGSKQEVGFVGAQYVQVAMA